MSKSLPPYGYLPYGYLPYGYLPYGYLPSLCIIPALWDILQFKYQKQTPVIKTLPMVAVMHVLRLNPANRLS